MKKTQEKAENLVNNRPEPGRYHVPNLDRALMILEFLAGQSQGRGVSEIARQLDIPKNSVFRIVSTLHAHGYLLRDDGVKTYSLGRKLLALGYAAVDEHNLMEKSLDALRDLRDATGETALIGTLGHGEGVVLEQMPSPHAVKVLVEIGHRFPLHTAAPAKAMLAFLPPDEAGPIIDGIRFTRFTEKTITDKEHYLAELEKIRRLGYAVDDGEELEGLGCVSAPVFNRRGRPLAAIWVTGPSFRLPREDFERVGDLVMKKAEAISRRFGYVLI